MNEKRKKRTGRHGERALCCFCDSVNELFSITAGGWCVFFNFLSFIFFLPMFIFNICELISTHCLKYVDEAARSSKFDPPYLIICFFPSCSAANQRDIR